MKRIFTLVAVLMMTANVWAQSPEKMSYQAVVRNSNDALVISQAVGMKVSILKGSATGSVVYVEIQKTSTNANGLISLEIGEGQMILGTFDAIDWADGTFFIKTEIDPTGGDNYTITGVSQLMSVPYALYAKTSGSSTPGPAGKDGIAGPAGKDGIAGPAGKDGIAGPAGPAGPAGKDGVDGKNGITSSNTAANGNLLTYDGTNWVSENIVTGNTGSGTGINNMMPYLTVNYIIALQGTFPSRSSSDPFIGEMIMFAGNFAPRGWAFCDGQLLPISQNQALFSILGTTYGGDGRTTFGLPDLRGRAPIHEGQGPGLTPRQLGSKSGTESVNLTTNQLPAHNHAIIIQK